MDISLGNRDARTGRFNFVIDPTTKDVQFDDTEAHAVMTSVMEDLGGYWADPAHGSELYKLKALSGRTPSVAEAMTLAALQTLEADNRITNVIVRGKPLPTDGTRPTALNVDLSWRTPNGDLQGQSAEV
jgi:phage gp46-like protein